MAKVNFVTPRIAVGSKWVTVAQLKKVGITHVLSVRRKPDRASIMENFHLFENSTEDDGHVKTHEYWEASVLFAKHALLDPDAKLYIHCAAGVHRGPATAVAVLMAFGYTADQAWSMVKKARPKAKRRYL